MAAETRAGIKALNGKAATLPAASAAVSSLLLSDFAPEAPNRGGRNHPSYDRWTHESDRAFTREELQRKIRARPVALFRMKGFARGTEGHGWLVQVVGSDIDLKAVPQPDQTRIVGIGLATGLPLEACYGW